MNYSLEHSKHYINFCSHITNVITVIMTIIKRLHKFPKENHKGKTKAPALDMFSLFFFSPKYRKLRYMISIKVILCDGTEIQGG